MERLVHDISHRIVQCLEKAELIQRDIDNTCSDLINKYWSNLKFTLNNYVKT